MVLSETTIPDLLSGPVNIKWEEGAPALVTSVYHTAVLYNGAIYVGVVCVVKAFMMATTTRQIFIIQTQTSGIILLTLHMHSLT